MISLNQVFDSINDGNPSILIDFSNIAGVQPAIDECLLWLLQVFIEVTGRHGWSF